MPNHITNEVEIKGTKEQIADLIKRTKLVLDSDADKNEFDFNGIVKMPEELLNTTSPTQIVSSEEEAIELNRIDKENAKKNGWGERTDRYLSQDEADRRTKEYNAHNWYDWAIHNWGTKWGAYDVSYTEGDNTKIVIKFDTAWASPEPIFAKLEEEGFEVRGVYYGEMEGYEYIGDGAEVFEAYQTVEVEYVG